MYVCGFQPYKSKMKLPPLAKYSYSEVKKAAQEQNVKPPPKLSPGMFVVVKRTASVTVAVYQFTNVTGCRNTSSAIHRNLPKPEENPQKLSLLWKSKISCKVGSRFLYDLDTEYTVNTTTGTLQFVGSGPLKKDLASMDSEESRCARLVHTMSQKFPEHTIQRWSNSDRYCPFRGGGDIIMYKGAGSAACVVHCTGAEQCDQEPTPSPASSREELHNPPQSQAAAHQKLPEESPRRL